MHTRGLQTLPTELASAVRPCNRCDHEVAFAHSADLRAHFLDRADELVTHPIADLTRLHRVVRPKIAAANAGARDADERVGRFDQPCIWNVLDAHVGSGIHNGWRQWDCAS